MSWLTGDVLRALTAPALILFSVLLVYLGFLVPKSSYPKTLVDLLLSDRDRQIAEWREAHKLSEQARDLDREATREVLEAIRTNNALLEGVRQAASWAERERGGST